MLEKWKKALEKGKFVDAIFMYVYNFTTLQNGFMELTLS